MSEDEVDHLFKASLTLKEYATIGLLYGSGLRISEVCALRIKDIESNEKRIKVYQGKGAKDRYTLLADDLVDKLRSFYIEAGRPIEYLFTSKIETTMIYLHLQKHTQLGIVSPLDRLNKSGEDGTNQ